MKHPELIDGSEGAHVLLVADHASNCVPPCVELGIDPALLDRHIAVDIGTAALTRGPATTLGAPAVLAGVSRLVIDLNREPSAEGLMPAVSDGQVIPGNAAVDDVERDRRLSTFHATYHDAVAAAIDRNRPELIVAVHSFTPRLASRPEEHRPWQVGLLYNRDARAATTAIVKLRSQGFVVGENQPYSGRQLNYTMNRHAEARGLPYLGIEIRQDMLSASGDIEQWRNILAEIIVQTLGSLRSA